MAIPAGAVGKVAQTDGQTIVVSVAPKKRLHHRDFIEVPFEREGKSHILIAQVGLLVGEDVKADSSTSILGISLDLEVTRVRATAKIIAFINEAGAVSALEPT